MTSHNGPQELISMLQYIKETRIDNPNILVKDSRILELDHIVTQVKESEEWEAVKMNILEVGIEKGRSEGEILKLLSQIRKKNQKGCSSAVIADALEEPEDYILSVLNLLHSHPDWTDEQLMNQLK